MHLEALKSKQREIFDKLNKFPNFYLAGGTALALQIRHRISVDFDLFHKKEIPINLFQKIKRVFEDFKVKIILNHSEQLSITVDGVKLDFVKYKFPLVTRLGEIKGVKIASVSEIAAMKAYTLNYRGTFKDYVDLYFILKSKRSTLKQIKKIAEEKYRDDFNFRLFLEQTIYLEDIKTEKIEFLKEKTDKEKIKDFFQKEIKKHRKEIL